MSAPADRAGRRALVDRCRLAAGTPPAWTAALRAALHRDPGVLRGLLVEQAHLEKKAAAAAVRLLFRVSYGRATQQSLSQLAREELVHFERTLRLLQARGWEFAAQPPQPYAEELKAACAVTMPERLVDELLVSAIIEARSCERMGCAADAVVEFDPEVATFYRDLVAAERRHHGQYLEVAATLLGAGAVEQRFGRIAAHEAARLAVMPFAPRLHSGLGGLAVAAPLQATPAVASEPTPGVGGS